MTLAAGYRLENPKVPGISPILLLADSRYSKGSVPYRDDGKKLLRLAKNIYGVFAGDVLEAQKALLLLKNSIQTSRGGSFQNLKSELKLAFEKTIKTWGNQTPHCLLAAMSEQGESRLLYAYPDHGNYEIREQNEAVIGWKPLEPELKKKICSFKPKGLSRPEQFMTLPPNIFEKEGGVKAQARHEAIDIARNITMDFLEVANDPRVTGVNPPIQSVLLLPGEATKFTILEIHPDSIANPKIFKRSARSNEVFQEPDPGLTALVELNLKRDA